MKIAIVYAARHGKLEVIAKTLGQTLESEGHRIDYIRISKGDRPPNLGRYDFLYIGSVSEGFWGTKIPIEISEFLKQCRGVQNVKSAAFLIKRFPGLNDRALRKFMAIIEHEGSMVMDFQVVGSKGDIELLAKRLRVI